MKPVLLSAGGTMTVYMVPDEVADHLKKYCRTFCDRWLPYSKEAAKYRVKESYGTCLCYNESDFIEYLNTHHFRSQPSRRAEGMESVMDESELPAEYRDIPSFNF